MKRGPRKNKVFVGNASGPRRKCGVRRREPLCGATGVYRITAWAPPFTQGRLWLDGLPSPPPVQKEGVYGGTWFPRKIARGPRCGAALHFRRNAAIGPLARSLLDRSSGPFSFCAKREWGGLGALPLGKEKNAPSGAHREAGPRMARNPSSGPRPQSPRPRAVRGISFSPGTTKKPLRKQGLLLVEHSPQHSNPTPLHGRWFWNRP